MSGEGWLENLRKMDSNKDIYCYANRGVVNFERAYQPLTLGCDASIFLHARPIFRKNEKGPKFDLFRVIPSQNIRTYFKKFYLAKRLWL